MTGSGQRYPGNAQGFREPLRADVSCFMGIGTGQERSRNPIARNFRVLRNAIPFHLMKTENDSFAVQSESVRLATREYRMNPPSRRFPFLSAFSIRAKETGTSSARLPDRTKTPAKPQTRFHIPDGASARRRAPETGTGKNVARHVNRIVSPTLSEIMKLRLPRPSQV